MILKNYANLATGQTHYRRSGSGQPVVLLHASPMSSEVMLPTIESLCDVADVISPDTPGYGQSDSLPKEMLDASEDLSVYVEWLASFLDDLGLQKISLYGSATGAQIAIEFARAYPERLTCVILDNAAHFTDQERTDIMRDYFPSIEPKADGAHLLDVWNMAGAVFNWFPWYQQDDAHRVSNVLLPPAAVHSVAMAYLSAGEDYAQAYRRAFANERAERVQEISAQTAVYIIRFKGGVLKKYTDRFDGFSWPEHIKMVHCEDRYATIKSLVSKHAS